MAKPRDTYKYYFKIGNKIVYGGITNDLERREQEHQQKWPKGHIYKVGRRTTDEAAREWEKDMTSDRLVKSPPISGSRKKIEYKKAAHTGMKQS
jgi:predicted GIY-YIG superfamily endonuclease